MQKQRPDSPSDYRLSCAQCGHQWVRRTIGKLPNQCPPGPGYGCGSRHWNEPGYNGGTPVAPVLASTQHE